MTRLIAPVVVAAVAALASSAWGEIRFLTDATAVTGCVFLTDVRDDSVKDLRKKITRIGGDSAVVSFGYNEMSAKVFRCENAGSSAPTSPTATTLAAPSSPADGLSGTFSGGISGNAKGQHFTMSTTFTLVQTGTQLTGVWNTTGGTSGGVTGMVAESGIPGMKIHQVNPCDGDFVGIAVVEAGGNRLRGSYVGTHCSGDVTGSFVVDRQQTGQSVGQPSVSAASDGSRATAEWECRRDVQALTSNARYATWGPIWWNLWQGHEQEEKIKESRAALFNSCMRAKGF